MLKSGYTVCLLIFSVFLILGCAASETSDSSSKDSSPSSVQVSPSPAETSSPSSESAPSIKEFIITARKWEFEPASIQVNKGDTVRLIINNIDVDHGFALPDFGINERLLPQKTVEVEFVADKTGTFPFFCSVYCGQGHGGMRGQLIVK